MWNLRQPSPLLKVKTLIYAAVGLYDTHSLNGFSPKVPIYKNSETICIPGPK